MPCPSSQHITRHQRSPLPLLTCIGLFLRHVRLALHPQAYVGRLGITHGSKPAVRALQEHCDSAMKTLLARLIRRLSGPLHLAECLRAVGYLKRLAPAAAAASSTAGKRGSDDAFAKLKDLR